MMLFFIGFIIAVIGGSGGLSMGRVEPTLWSIGAIASLVIGCMLMGVYLGRNIN